MMRPSILGWSGAIAVAALMVAACGGSTNSTPPARTTPSSASTQTSAPASTQGGSAADACALITEQEATTALGHDPGRGIPQALPVGSACLFQSGTALLEVSVRSGDRAQFDATRAGVQAQDLQDVTGVGDAAFVATTNIHAGVLVLLKNSVLVQITFASAASLTAPANTLTTLGRAAAGRM